VDIVSSDQPVGNHIHRTGIPAPRNNPKRERNVMASNRLRSIRHLLAAATLSVSCFAAAPALAQVSGLEIVAPASPGGGWDQHARALQQTLMSRNLATGV
jgi:hypothetical protein